MSKTRQRLINAAARMFARRGFDATSVRDIIGAAGANLGAVTYHFGSKENLLAEVVAQKIQPFIDINARIAASNDPPETRLRAMFEAYAVHALYTDPGLKVLFSEIIAGGRRLPRSAIEGVAERNRVFADIVRQGIRQGIFRECDIECVTWNFFGTLSAYILYRPLLDEVGRHKRYPRSYVSRIVDTALSMFLDGIKVRPGLRKTGVRGKPGERKARP